VDQDALQDELQRSGLVAERDILDGLYFMTYFYASISTIVPGVL